VSLTNLKDWIPSMPNRLDVEIAVGQQWRGKWKLLIIESVHEGPGGEYVYARVGSSSTLVRTHTRTLRQEYHLAS
jgi:hypothetical protein